MSSFDRDRTGRRYSRDDNRDDSRRYPPSSSHRTFHRASRSQSPQSRSPRTDYRQDSRSDNRTEGRRGNIMQYFQPSGQRPDNEPLASRSAAPVSQMSSQSTSYSRDGDRGGRGGHRGGRGRHDHRDAGGRDYDRRDYGRRDRDRSRDRDRHHNDNRGRSHGRDHGRGRHRLRGGNSNATRARYAPGQQMDLTAVAKSTQEEVGKILQALGTDTRASAVQKYDPWNLPPLDPSQCPKFPRPATIRVLQSDTINAALDLQRFTQADIDATNHRVTDVGTPLLPPAVVNFASYKSPGGGWLRGHNAQEEALCYRSSLYRSLDRDLYPLGREEILYSPYAVIMRHDMSSGHQLMTPAVPLRDLPIMSVLSVAALERPRLRMAPANGSAAHEQATQSTRRSPSLEGPSSRRSSLSQASSAISWSQSQVPADPPPEYTSQPTTRSQSQQRQSRSPSAGAGSANGERSQSRAASASPRQRSVPPARSPLLEADIKPPEKSVFAYETDVYLTKLKMRLVLRAAARAGHHQLVLGALGCGVYANPPEQVARLWLEVLQDPEFTSGGNWWQDVVFAVYDGTKGSSGHVDLGTRAPKTNFGIFHQILNGQQV